MRLNHDEKRDLSRALCQAGYESSFEGVKRLLSESEPPMELEHVWHASRGEGFQAIAAKFVVDEEDVMAISFRGTVGKHEWFDYVRCHLPNPKFLRHRGHLAPPRAEGGEHIYRLWEETVDKVCSPGCRTNGQSFLEESCRTIVAFVDHWCNLPVNKWTILCWSLLPSPLEFFRHLSRVNQNYANVCARR